MAYPYSRYPLNYDDPGLVPNDQKGIPVTVNNVTPVSEEVMNRQKDAILAVQRELGIKPSGHYGTVRDRLDALEQLIGSGGGGGGGGGILYQVRVTPTNGQTVFTLPVAALNNILIFFIDGLQQDSSTFTVSGTTVTYFGAVPLITTDFVEFYYLIDSGGGGGGGGGGIGPTGPAGPAGPPGTFVLPIGMIAGATQSLLTSLEVLGSTWQFDGYAISQSTTTPIITPKAVVTVPGGTTLNIVIYDRKNSVNLCTATVNGSVSVSNVTFSPSSFQLDSGNRIIEIQMSVSTAANGPAICYQAVLLASL